MDPMLRPIVVQSLEMSSIRRMRARPNLPRKVGRGVLLPVDRWQRQSSSWQITSILTARDDTADTTESDDQGGSERSLGGSSDVVLRVGNDGRDVALGAGDGEESTKVPRTERAGVGQDGQTDDTDDVAADDERSPESELVTQDGGAKGVDGGEDVWRRAQDEGELDVETASGKDDGEEKGDCRQSLREKRIRPDSQA